jgi:poly(3-hydroxybutyrate) depolymerase
LEQRENGRLVKVGQALAPRGFGAVWLALATGCGATAPPDRAPTYVDAGEIRLPDATVAATLDGGDDAADDATGLRPPAGATDGAAPPALNIDLSQTSVSGVSSGAFMAVQFGVAFSSITKGIGVFAGGPFGCSGGSVVTAQSECQASTIPPDVTPLVALTKSLAASGAIDDPSLLASTRIFLFGGADDTVVFPPIVDATQAYFAAFVPAASITYVSRRAATGHRIPTLSYGGACDASTTPWIGNCGYDGVGAALAQIYGTLLPPSAAASGTIRTLAQGDFVPDPTSHSLDTTAYVYVPAACAAGETCRVHVAFHGCGMQATGSVGSAFYLHAGYDEWADTNHLVVLYPQTIASAANPYACWDWWGYDSAQFDTKSAPQMAMTRAMIAQLAGAGGGGGVNEDP